LATGDVVDLAKLLSPAQYAAATRLDVPVCILAGAGSGKTRVITHRIAWLMTEQRQTAESILAVTFTNKAAGEMRERVEKLVPGRGSRVLLGTFHGLAARLLRRFGRIVGVPPGFVIYDADDAERLLQRLVVNDLNMAKEAAGPIGRLIDGWQCEGLGPRDVPEGHELLFRDALKAYDRYLEKLAESSALDFGGLLLKLRDLVRHDDAAAALGHVRHVLVDEYQDVNRVQADIVLAFARRAMTIAVVGDDDQAIYGWRGASADNLKKFLGALPGATLLKLEENYRSTPAILQAANGIIAKNEVRLGKVLRPAGNADDDADDGIRGRDRGRNVRVVRGADDVEEARRVGGLLIEHVMGGTRLDDIAILYRANAQSRLMEDELRRLALPYRVVGGVRFYDRKEVKDVLATVRAALVRRSDVDALRFLAAVPRGIGDTTVKKVDAVARSRRRPLLEVFADPALLAEAGLSAAAQKKCSAVVMVLDELAAKIGRPQRSSSQQGLFSAAATLGAKDALALAVQASGVADRLAAEGGLEAEGRLENLAELVNAAATFEELARRNGEAGDIEAFLESAALLGSADDAPQDDGRGQVTLMTLHAAKGLEFDVVFLVGLEEHGFPHSRAVLDDDDRAIEEERRLAYVGITRAKRRLVVSYASRRMVQGVVKARDPSRFLFEIPRDVLEGDIPRRGSDGGPGRGAGSPLLDEWRRRQGGSARSLRTDLGADHDDDHGNEDDGASGVRVVYDDDGAPVRARRPKEPRTLLVPRPDTAALDDGGEDNDAGPTGPVVVRDDEEGAGGVGGFGGAARRFRLGTGARVVADRTGGTARPTILSSAVRMTPTAATTMPTTATSTAPASTTTVVEERDDGGEARGFSAGARVFHRLFGDGTVVGARGAGRALNCLVRFDSQRAPRLIAARHLKPVEPGDSA
jgi:DNA helicase-2/ATP-dependent DNA helicase PcrA